MKLLVQTRLLLLLSALAVISRISVGVYGLGDDGYDYVKEVLEEDDHHHDDGGYYSEDPPSASTDDFEKRQQEAEQRRQEEADRLAQQEADRIAAKREKEFEAELAKMNVDQQKAAKKQKKKDARVVRSVLKAAQKKKLYAVLGIKNWNMKIPSRDINIAGKFGFTIPGLTLKETTAKDIKRAYRNQSKLVHPDKNRDGHAQEAFIAVENAASILGDPKQRAEYDKIEKARRQQRQQESTDVIFKSLGLVRASFMKAFKVVHSVFGPFATPVIILGALMF